MIGHLLALLVVAGMPPVGADLARYAAGDTPVEQNVKLVRVAPIDGDPRVETHAGRDCLRADRASGNPYIYFDVSRRWLKSRGFEPYAVELTIEYFDDTTEALAVQYDSVGGSVEANFREASWRGTGSREWRTATVALRDGEFRNGQQGLADLRIAGSPAADVRVASITLRVTSAADKPTSGAALPEPRLPSPNEVSVSAARAAVIAMSPLGESERIALDRLNERFRAVGEPPPTVRESRPAAGTTLVIGRWRSAMSRDYPRTAKLVRRLQSDPVAFRRRDGYVVSIERGGPSPVICAVGLSSPGAVYAIGHLHTRLLRDGVAPVLRLDASSRIEAPRLDRRELYLNIGYGLGRPGITSEFWDDAEWRRYIDVLVLARYNTWSFYLWADSALIHPVARANRELNERLHRRLRNAIAYSHKRGVRVGMQFSPSMLPVEVWNDNQAIRAKLEYTYPGTVCPEHPEARPLIRDIHGTELRWFSNVDFYSLWFYDVGGCFCERCRVPGNQLASLLWQVRTFADIARATNPRATFQVMTWAVWRYEKRHGYSIRERFVRDVVDMLRARVRSFELADGIYVDPETKPLFDLMVKAKAPAKAFLYQTNIETGQPFLIVQTRYLARWVPASIKSGATSAFLMRMEAGTKRADDIVAGSYLWNPSIPADLAILDCARFVTGDLKASQACWEALRRIDDFAWFGHAGGGAGTAQGETIARLTARAVQASPPSMRKGLDWLETTGEAYRILGRAVDARDDEDAEAVAELDKEFSAAMRRSPQFRQQAEGAPYWRDLFTSALVRYFHAGWRTYHF